ncbi:UDP-N-acetylmuramate--L-alanine ligase [Candidatus Riflebacteria bacterium]
MDNNRHIHFIGIGGIGMSGLAVLAKDANFEVSGSDLSESSVTRSLKKNGISVYIPHKAENVNGAGTVVYSSAIKEENPELIAAKKSGKKIMHRSEYLSEVLAGKLPICISGTHGKTTTTALISHILNESGWEPSCLVGGNYHLWNSNVLVGKSPWMVVEADESDGSLLRYEPFAAVVTNVDNDHLDYYSGISQILETFEQFLNQVKEDGIRVLYGDCDHLFEISKNWPGACVTYGFQKRNAFTIDDVEAIGRKTAFNLSFRDMLLGRLIIPLIGQHNILNSSAAAITSFLSGVTFTSVKNAIATFAGVHRRSEVLFKNEFFTLMDDYAHHPTEIRETLKSIKERCNGRLVVIFQPHRYSRTQQLYKEFASALCLADKIYLCPIYSAGDKPIVGVDTSLIQDSIPLPHLKKVKYLPNLEQAYLIVDQESQSGDTILSMGAGNVRLVTEKLARIYSEHYTLAASS